tara:strand:+ start:4194 stop:5081 length:888 start_codon:yes stop_codon:yes gene_type:complete
VSNKSKKNILVIGGSGFIGSHTADALSESGHKITILDKVQSNWQRDDQEMLIADIMNQEILETSMKNIDVVYYFAGIADIGLAKSNPYETIELNIMGLTKALEAALKNNVKKFIYASTMYVYSSHGSFYRASKQAAEIIIETYQENFGLEYVFLRYGSLYGPRAQNWNGIRGFIEQVIEKGFLEYHGNGSEVREYIHALDAAKLSVKVLEKEFKNRSVTITGQQSIKVSDMLAMIFEIEGKKVDIRYLNKVEGTPHYGITPYRYTPKTSMKLTPVEFFDLGQGILNIVEEIHNNK